MGRFTGPINFSQLVLEPAMATFADKSFTYTPPGGAIGGPADVPDMRGSWSVDSVEMAEGEIAARGVANLLGVRLADFPEGVVPAQGGRLTFEDAAIYTVHIVIPDAKGGAHLELIEGDVTL